MKKRNYSGYVNPKLNNSNKIFTREEIAKMPRAEFAANEKAIDYQMSKIGIPSVSDLQESSGVVHVNAYTKDDGTDVREHYRSAPNRVSNDWGMGVEGDENENNDNNTQDNSSEEKIPRVYKGSAEKNVYKNNDGVMLPVPPDDQEEPLPDPQPEPPPEPDPQPSNEDEEQNISELKEIADLAKQIAQSMNSLKQIASSKANKENLSLPVSSKYSGAINRYSNNIELSKTNLKRAINKSKSSLQKQGNELKKIVDEAVNTTNQSKYGQLMQKITAKKQALSNHSQALNHIESLFQNEDYQGIEDGYGNQGSGGGGTKVGESLNNETKSNKKKGNSGFVNNYKIEDFARTLDQINSNNQKFHNNNNLDRLGYELEGIPDKFGKAVIKTGLESMGLQGVIASSLLYGTSAMQSLDKINYDLNIIKHNRPLTYELMKHSIYNLQDVPSTPNCRTIDSSYNYDLSHKLRKEIPAGMRGVGYTSDSRIAREIANDRDFKTALKLYLDQLKNGKYPVTQTVAFNSNPDLFASIHGATITNVQMDKDGSLSAIISDVYDFAWNKNWHENLAKEANAAVILQDTKVLEKYYVIIQVRVPKEEINQILRGKTN